MKSVARRIKYTFIILCAFVLGGLITLSYFEKVREMRMNSPTFLGLSLLIAVLSAAGAMIPLVQYRNSLKLVMSLLEEKLRSPAWDLTLLQANADGVSSQMIELVNRFAIQQTEMQKVIDSREKDRDLCELAAQVAHDIRSPLSALNVLAAALKMEDDSRRVLVEQVVARINCIASRMLEAARPGPAQTSVAELIRSIPGLICEKEIEHQCKIARIGFAITENSHFEDRYVVVNADEMKQALSNLINNAIEGASPKRKLEVGVQVECDQSKLRVSVTDNGRGIPPEVAARAGERGNSFAKDGGSGLGLYFARNLAKAGNGRLDVRSKLGSGTDVSIELAVLENYCWTSPNRNTNPNPM